jgi:glutamine synthetase
MFNPADCSDWNVRSRKASASGVSFLVGFESEFILLKSTRPVQAVKEHYPMDTKALIAGSVEEKLLEEISDGIQASGIELQLYHAEASPGQVGPRLRHEF